jgi:hypothetical protein
MNNKKSAEKMAKALAELKFRRLGNIFMEPSDYDEIPLCKVLYFVRGTDYRRNKADGDAQLVRKWLECMGRLVLPPHS